MKRPATKGEASDRLSTAEEVQFACGITVEDAPDRPGHIAAGALASISLEELAEFNESELAYFFSSHEPGNRLVH